MGVKESLQCSDRNCRVGTLHAPRGSVKPPSLSIPVHVGKIKPDYDEGHGRPVPISRSVLSHGRPNAPGMIPLGAVGAEW
ncbi:MAG: hypothetical protein AAB253_05885 [candidate division NC10 bacterium]